jgi:hypothetical protein
MTTFLKEANMSRDWRGVPNNEAEAMGRLAEPKGYVRRDDGPGYSTHALWQKLIGNKRVTITGHTAEGGLTHWVITIEDVGYGGSRIFAGGEKGTELISNQVTAMKKAEEAERYVPTMGDYKEMTPEEVKAKDTLAAKEISSYYGRGPGSYTGD